MTLVINALAPGDGVASGSNSIPSVEAVHREIGTPRQLVPIETVCHHTALPGADENALISDPWHVTQWGPWGAWKAIFKTHQSCRLWSGCVGSGLAIRHLVHMSIQVLFSKRVAFVVGT